MIGVLVTLLPGGPEPPSAGPTDTREAQFYRPPRPMVLTRDMRREVDATVDEFVRAAVLRKDVARSWELAGPALRLGVTKAEWMRGELPVFPYPADPERTAWDLEYADRSEVALNVTLVARRGLTDPPEVFGVALQPVRRGRERTWLVSSWYPRGSVSQPQPPPPEAAPAGTAALTPEEREAVRRASEGQIDRIWWLIPAGVLALIVLGPLAWFAAVRLRAALGRPRDAG